MSHSVEREIAGRTLRLETGKLAKQANGAVWLTCGETAVLAAATMSREARTGIDFFPLTCDYEERRYAVGKIPGGFVKRGGRPSEKSVLTSRLIDRPLRPLFPYGMRNDVQVIAMPMSVDAENVPDTLAMVAASAALTISNIPFGGPIGAVRIGRIAGELIMNPSRAQLQESDMDLVIAGTSQAILMIEAGAQFATESEMLDAIETGHEVIRQQCSLQLELAALAGVPKVEVQLFLPNEAILSAIHERMDEAIRSTIINPDKAARESAIDDLKREIVNTLTPEFPDNAADISEAAEKAIKLQIRHLIIEEGIRPDGRKADEIRQISCEVGLLPRVHGSGLFTRGQTQVLTALTLGARNEAQLVESSDSPTEEKKRYMHYYNFPPYSVGEVRPLRSAGRREIGHGSLAERSLVPVLPDEEEFPYCMLLQSEVLESNGSTSMASVCGSTLALMDAGVKIKAPVAGVAMGLMTMGDKYAVLTDIQGMEDFSGDMDFKVAGTEEGITAIQLDCKIQGLPHHVMVEALEQARKGRLFILDKIVSALNSPREELNKYAPSIIVIEIDPEKIGEIIGPGGKMIKKISAETGAQIDIQQDGKVFVAAPDQEAGRKAAAIIMGIAASVEVGQVFSGKVVRLIGMGAFVEFLPGKDGLVHVSHLSDTPVRRPEDAVKVGDDIMVRVIEVDSQGRVNLSAINLDQPFDRNMAKRSDDGRPPRSGRPPERDRDRSPRPQRPEPPVEEEKENDNLPKARFRPRR